MLRPKLVLLLTEIFQSYLFASLSASASVSPCIRDTVPFILLWYWKSTGTNHYTTVTLNGLQTILFFDDDKECMNHNES